MTKGPSARERGRPCASMGADLFSERFVPVMDRLQLILDESEFSSELHFILRRRQ